MIVTCTVDYWDHMIFLSSISLFILAPFAFLYYEAEGFGLKSIVSTSSDSADSSGRGRGGAGVGGTGPRSFSARFFETFVILILFTVLIYGSFRLMYSIWSGEPIVTAFTTFLSSNLGHATPGMCIFMCTHPTTPSCTQQFAAS